MPRSAPRLALLLLAATLALAGCQNDQERADAYLRSAQELIGKGDVDRALIELRNVFRYDGQNRLARQTYADLLLQRGEMAEAYSQYLRLVEQNPDDLELRLKVANMALDAGNGTELATQTAAAERLAERDPRVRALRLALDYADAGRLHDAAAATRAADAAEVLLATNDTTGTDAAGAGTTTAGAGLEAARRIVVDRWARSDTPERALPFIEAGLAATPASYPYNSLKFSILAQAGRTDAATAQIRHMHELYPQSQQVQSTLISWFLRQGDTDTAEAYVRELAAQTTTDAAGNPAPAAGPLLVVDFLNRARGPEAALAELDRLIDGAPEAERGLYQASRATLLYARGDHDKAISDLQAALKDRAASAETDRMKTALAQMLLAGGNAVGARSLVEEVLAHDATQVEALKLRARMRIDEDKPSEAISDLRTALDQAPQDPDILTLMANAHLREGRKDLAGERLSLAVDVSNAAPGESLRYAAFLLQDGRVSSAQAVLERSAAAFPGAVPVLGQLADIYLRQNDWAQSGRLLEQLRDIDTDEARRTAQRLQAALLLGQNRTDEGIGLLQSLVGDGSDAATVSAVLQTQVRAGRLEEARSYLAGLLADRPEDPALRLLGASLDAMAGLTDSAEATLRKLVAEDPAAEGPARVLYGLLLSANRRDEADSVLDAAIAARPDSPVLLWMKADALERRGAFEGAIEIYERLYARDSNNMTIANNLASMLASYRDDDESLTRAETIGQRLRNTTQAAFQDTYGWILFRKDQVQESVRYLEPAAHGLPNDALAQFHLGMAYERLGRGPEAQRQMRRALEIAGDGPLPQMDEARAVLARLEGREPPAAAPDAEAAPGTDPAAPAAPPAATGQDG